MMEIIYVNKNKTILYTLRRRVVQKKKKKKKEKKRKEKVESNENWKNYHQNTERIIYPAAPVMSICFSFGF